MRVDPSVWALIPARDEEGTIVDTVRSLLAQTVCPGRIVVVADHCRDRTAAVVRERFGESVRVIERMDGRPGKSRALNAGFAAAFVSGATFVVTIDADTICDVRFVEAALAEIEQDQRIGGVGARCLPRPAAGSRMQRALWMAQYHEYAREDSARIERLGAVDIMPGAGMLLRTAAVLDAGGWAEDSLVEDHRLSIQMRRRGWRTVVGSDCFCITRPPDTARKLWRQRRRWYGGVISEVRRFGGHDALGFGRNQYRLNNVGALGSLVALATLIAFVTGRGPMPVGFGVVPALAVGVIDQFVRLRYLPRRTMRDFVWAASPMPTMYALFRQSIWIASLIRPSRRQW